MRSSGEPPRERESNPENDDETREGRRRIEVTGGDPWVRSHAVRQRIMTETSAGSPERQRRYQEDKETSQRRALIRRQSTFLGAIFASLALVVFFGTRLLAPQAIVLLDGGAGVVLIDGEEAGRTGTLLDVNPGSHTIQVLPDTVDVIVEPSAVSHKFRYSWDPVSFHFQLIHRVQRRSGSPSVQDSTSTEGGP